MSDSRPLRSETTCRGCGGPKDDGCLVCWSCFKTGPQPYKYFVSPPDRWHSEVLQLDDWLAAIGAPEDRRVPCELIAAEPPTQATGETVPA